MSTGTAPDTTTLTVLLADDPATTGLPAVWPAGVRVDVIDHCDTAATTARKLFVVASATSLGAVAECVSVANRANRLQALLVRSDVDPTWVPFMFAEAGLRVLRNVLVHAGGDLPVRLLTAWAHGEQHDTIADAAVVGDELVVRSCALDVLRVRFDAYPALRRIRPEDRSDFEVDADGVLLHWPVADVHLDLEAARTANDPARQTRLRARQLAEDAAFGSAIRALREEHGLTQAEVTRRSDLSERQLRRIESGEAPGDDALDRLAIAHGMAPDSYLNAVSERMTDRGAAVEISRGSTPLAPAAPTQPHVHTVRQRPAAFRMGNPYASNPTNAAGGTSHYSRALGARRPRKVNVHTTPNPSGAGWVNQVGGQVVSRHRTQGNAVERGREIARDARTEHVIHRPDGSIRDKNSYGNDPNPPKDKR
jgi:transcriptional regulator with XRE-family HTH domain